MATEYAENTVNVQNILNNNAALQMFYNFKKTRHSDDPHATDGQNFNIWMNCIKFEKKDENYSQLTDKEFKFIWEHLKDYAPAVKPEKAQKNTSLKDLSNKLSLKSFLLKDRSRLYSLIRQYKDDSCDKPDFIATLTNQRIKESNRNDEDKTIPDKYALRDIAETIEHYYDRAKDFPLSKRLRLTLFKRPSKFMCFSNVGLLGCLGVATFIPGVNVATWGIAAVCFAVTTTLSYLGNVTTSCVKDILTNEEEASKRGEEARKRKEEARKKEEKALLGVGDSSTNPASRKMYLGEHGTGQAVQSRSDEQPAKTNNDENFSFFDN